ncbi:MAG TPA: YceI family protein [Chitinophagaceae bacterium]|jgi:polyisoprenoid-binding protein YceI
MRISTISTLVLAMVIVTTSRLSAQLYQPIDGKSTVKFVIKNFGINTGGDFKGLQGTIAWDAATPDKSFFDISVDASTVNTSSDGRDNHLRQEEYFNVAQFPKISFVSAKIIPSGSSFTVRGKLSIKGVTKDISIPFTAVAKDDGYLFEGTFTIDRRDFKVGGNSAVMGDNVLVSLSVFAAKK